MNRRNLIMPALALPLSFLIPIAVSTAVNVPDFKRGDNVKVSARTEDMKRLGSSADEMVITVFNTEENKTDQRYLEEYLCGVVAAEMPAAYEIEALKAQAVAARSYIISKLGTQNDAHSDAVVCTSASHCKAYISSSEAAKRWGDEWEKTFYPKIRQAVSETSGEYLVHNGEPVTAFFFALSNGKTENSEEVWGGSLPYIESRDSSFDASSPDFLSYAEFREDEFYKRLKGINKDFEEKKILSVSELVLTEGGRVKSVKINGAGFSGTDIRSAFSLKSADFSLKKEGGKIVFTVRGNGHGVGMSQYGANVLAKNGADYREILSHYYKDVEIMEYGGIEIITK